MKKAVALILLLLAVSLGFFIVKGKKKGKIVPVEVTQVKRGEVKKVIDATGIIKPQVGAEITVPEILAPTFISAPT